MGRKCIAPLPGKQGRGGGGVGTREYVGHVMKGLMLPSLTLARNGLFLLIIVAMDVVKPINSPSSDIIKANHSDLFSISSSCAVMEYLATCVAVTFMCIKRKQWSEGTLARNVWE